MFSDKRMYVSAMENRGRDTEIRWVSGVGQSFQGKRSMNIVLENSRSVTGRIWRQDLFGEMLSIEFES